MLFRFVFILFLFQVIFPAESAFAQVVNAIDQKPDREEIMQEALVNAQEQKDLTLPSKPQEDLSLLEQNRLIKQITVTGNKSISAETILSKIKTRSGDEYRPNIIRDDIKRIYNTGYFSDVNVDRVDYEGGYKVIFRVEEKPVVDTITFSKLTVYSPATLSRKIKTRAGKFLDNKELKDDIKTLQTLYEKKGMTLVDIKAETDRDPLTNKVKIHFVIKEGYRVKVRRITFNGNKIFSHRRLIKVVKSRNAWLFNSGYLKEDVTQEDVDRLKAFYEKEGFIDAKVAYESKESRKGMISVIFNIEEGKRYYVDKIEIQGNTVFPTSDILATLTKIRPDAVFSRQLLEEDLANVQTLYMDKGYIFVHVRESTAINSETGKVAVRLDITEGEVAYINKIKIQGNDRTRDVVIRRELRLYPGDRFDGAKLRRTKERLNNLGYFEDVSYDAAETDRPNYRDLVVNVQEAKTGSLSFGGGYSSVEKLVGFVDISQRNFDITNWPTFTGGGQQLDLRFEVGSLSTNSRLSFTEPWLFDYPVSGGFDIYAFDHDRDEDIGYAYDERRVGFNLRLGKEFSEYLSGGINFRREDVKIGNFDSDVAADILAEEGKNTLSVWGLNLTQDHRDSTIAPTKGWFLKETMDIASKMAGGDKEFTRYRLYGGYYLSLPRQAVLEFSVRPGVVIPYGDSDKVPIFERFFAGGATTIRGYDERKVGPLDSATDDPIGGEGLFLAGAEYTIPLIDFIKFAAFFDAGNVWADVGDYFSSKLYMGSGIGLRIKTPIAPMKLDYGYPLNAEQGEEKRSGKFYFSFGRAF